VNKIDERDVLKQIKEGLKMETAPSKPKGWKSKIRKFRDAFKAKDSLADDFDTIMTSKELRCVRFGKVAVREHARILGDHPACLDGLALALDWKHSERTTVMELDLYERRRSQEGRYEANEMRKLSANARVQILQRIGCIDETLLRRSYMTSPKGSAKAA
jgi:hypothetical protein